MPRSQNTPLLLALVVCIMVVAGVMIAAIFLAGQKPVLVVMPAAPTAPAGPAVSGVVEGGPGTTPPPAIPAPQPVEVTVARIAAVPPLANVFDAAWDKIPPTDVPLLPQQTAAPMLDSPTIASVQVQAIRDDKRVVWRLSWAATQPASLSETGHFADAVAIQIPLADGAPFTMGAKGQPVRLLHWKALWQKDIDFGFQDIAKLYPNAWSDLNWFAPHTGPVPTTQLVKDPKAVQFLPLHAAGNPMAITDRKQPVEEIAAEGFGTATTIPNSPSTARGVWKDGRWTVIIDRPLAPDDPISARLQSAQNLISFAVWDGSADNRGGRKHYCAWVPLKVEP